MAVADRLDAGRVELLRRPKTALLAVLVGLLALDLLAKLVGFGLFVGSTKVLGGEQSVEQLITFAWDGVVVGLGIGLAGVGLSVTYSILGFANFAHGDYVTTGSFVGWSAAWVVAGFQAGLIEDNLGYLATVGAGEGPSSSALGINVVNTPLAVLAGLVLAVLGTVAIVLLIDRAVFEPMRDESGISLLIGSVGVALALRYVVATVYGPGNHGLTANTPKLILGGVDGRLAVADGRGTLIVARNTGEVGDALYYELPLVGLGGYSKNIIQVTSAELTLVFVAVALMYGLHLLLQRTKLGKAMRAMADNEDLARVTGIPTERVVRLAWIIGGGMTGAAGYLIALERGTMTFRFGWVLLLFIFAAVILGGIGSVYGAMFGGVTIGVVSTVALVWIPNSFTTAAAFFIMILILLVKPDGLFGGVTTA